MRLSLTFLTLLGFLAGCSSETLSSKAEQSSAAQEPAGVGASLSGQPVPTRMPANRIPLDASFRPAAKAGAEAFAGMPDMGVLMGYQRRDAAVRRGAFTSYPIQLSEEHALHAIGSREMVVTTPDGRQLRLQYERHIEHPDGNWSWVGHLAGSSDRGAALITFGPKAVFGTIPDEGNQTLRLTTAAGRSWLVVTDRSKLPGTQDAAPRASDYLVPPQMASEMQAAGAAPTPATAGAAATAAAGTTVDVVLGYTNGLVTSLGGVSQTTTRLNHLVDVTNEAYLNSQISATLRLVATVQVNYPDATDNGDALEKLTGYKSGTGGVTPDPAFSALRAARDQYGADLVSLVRAFRTPENAGCGIAWLIGGDQTAIDAGDAPFGYSVVSDGQDVNETDNKTYFCREETLAHELGHNMGQAHNVEDSSGTGAHAYSYGYREAATTGFYTVMAYRLANSSQFSIRYFGSPNISYSGRPTGTASADNARSLVQTIPTIATFRAAVVPVTSARPRNDMDGNGKSDLVWWNPSLGAFAYWSMNGSQFASGFNQTLGATLTPSTTGRSTASGRTDILMRRVSDRTMFSYQSTASGMVPYTIGQYGEGWVVAGQGDIDGDGKDDIFWRHPVAGYFAYWYMDGPVYKGGQTYTPPASYQIAAIEDFNGDGRVDIVWNDPGSRIMSMWLSVGSGFTVSQIGQYGADWRLVGAADVTGDGKTDLLWRDTANNYLAYWRMDGAVYQGAHTQGTQAGLVLAAIGDYNADRIADLVWQRPADNRLIMWVGNGTGFDEVTVGQYDPTWQLQP